MENIIDRAAKYIDKVKWQYAKTMPQMPHEYTRRVCSIEAGLEDDFVWFVLAIREFGFKHVFGRRTYMYLKVDDYHYWTMGDLIENTILINRAVVKGL
jgi:hypothetical protein